MNEQQQQRPRHSTFADLPPERRKEIASAGGKKSGGFRAMTPERRSEVARMGAQALRVSGKGHRWTSEEAREAGRVGGTRGKPYTRKPKPEKEMETKREPAALPEYQ